MLPSQKLTRTRALFNFVNDHIEAFTGDRVLWSNLDIIHRLAPRLETAITVQPLFERDAHGAQTRVVPR